MKTENLKHFITYGNGKMIADIVEEYYLKHYNETSETIQFTNYQTDDIFKFAEAAHVLTETKSLPIADVKNVIARFPNQARLKAYMLLEWHYIPNRHTDRNEFEVDYFDIDRGVVSVTYRPNKDGDLYDWTEAVFPVEWLKIANELTDADWDYINGYSTSEEIEKYLNAGMEVIYV